VPDKVCKTTDDVDEVIDLLIRAKLPMTVSWKRGKHRSLAQNRLHFLWCREISEQRGDEGPGYYRAMNKLRFGVPILRHDDTFRELYDKTLKPLSYEDKLAVMDTFDFPVTRLMSVAQLNLFLDEVYRFWTNEGIQLTEPDGPYS